MKTWLGLLVLLLAVEGCSGLKSSWSDCEYNGNTYFAYIDSTNGVYKATSIPLGVFLLYLDEPKCKFRKNEIMLKGAVVRAGSRGAHGYVFMSGVRITQAERRGKNLVKVRVLQTSKSSGRFKITCPMNDSTFIVFQQNDTLGICKQTTGFVKQ